MRIRDFLFFTMAVGFFSGCLAPQTDQARFYFLSAPGAEPSAATVAGGQFFLVGLRVTSAEYLRGKQMLVELESNQLKLSEDNLWQETPRAGFARVLAGQFARSLPNCQLTSLPAATTNAPEFVLEIELRSMQGRLKPRSEAEVSAEVRILDAKSHLLERDELRRTAPWNFTEDSNRYPALAAAESRAAADLADAIAEKVLECRRRTTVR